MKIIIAIAFIFITSSHADTPKKFTCYECRVGAEIPSITGGGGSTTATVAESTATEVTTPDGQATTEQVTTEQVTTEQVTSEEATERQSFRKLRRSIAFQHQKRYFRAEDNVLNLADVNEMCKEQISQSKTKKDADACYIITVTPKGGSAETIFRLGGPKGLCNSKGMEGLKKNVEKVDCEECSGDNCNLDKGKGSLTTKKPKGSPTESTPGSPPASSTAKPADKSSAGRIEYGFFQLFLLTSMVLCAWLQK